ncbi:uncharacterized protein LOC119430927 [Dermacentor silvarum]|uniref:uncharacterized protein LOC119430927 n=1 Tax=Dermacentor silvarum TaxID=543639 RepID=UPI002101D45C|nr:uncharacterized protein LOC119430927 [Dermacentor silvarum]
MCLCETSFEVTVLALVCLANNVIDFFLGLERLNQLRSIPLIVIIHLGSLAASAVLSVVLLMGAMRVYSIIAINALRFLQGRLGERSTIGERRVEIIKAQLVRIMTLTTVIIVFDSFVIYRIQVFSDTVENAQV